MIASVPPDIEVLIGSRIPENLTFLHLSNLRPGWQVCLADATHEVFSATGDSPELAISATIEKWQSGKSIGKLYSNAMLAPSDREVAKAQAAQATAFLKSMVKSSLPVIRRR